jgi:hypothetical protein
MNMECQNRAIPFRSMPVARSWILVAMLSAAALPTPCLAQGTLEQQLACTPDVLRLCSAFIPNADEITACLRDKTAELSDACKPVIEASTNQPPDASDNAGARKRATK